jgi:hypothetical protein
MNTIIKAFIFLFLLIYTSCLSFAVEFGFYNNKEVRQLKPGEQIGQGWAKGDSSIDYDNFKPVKDHNYYGSQSESPVLNNESECNCYYKVRHNYTEAKVVSACGMPDTNAIIEVIQHPTTVQADPGTMVGGTLVGGTLVGNQIVGGTVVGGHMVGGSTSVSGGQTDTIYEWSYIDCPIGGMATRIKFKNGSVIEVIKKYY